MAVIIKTMSSVSVCIFGLVAPENLDYINHIYSPNRIYSHSYSPSIKQSLSFTGSKCVINQIQTPIYLVQMCTYKLDMYPITPSLDGIFRHA